MTLSPDERITALLTLAAELWVEEHPDAALELAQANLTTSSNKFLWLAEPAVCKVVLEQHGSFR